MEKFKLISNRFSDADVTMEIVAVDKASTVIAKVSDALDKASDSQSKFNDENDRLTSNTKNLSQIYSSTVNEMFNVGKSIDNLMTKTKASNSQMQQFANWKESFDIKDFTGSLYDKSNISESAVIQSRKQLNSLKKIEADLQAKINEEAAKEVADAEKAEAAYRKIRLAKAETFKKQQEAAEAEEQKKAIAVWKERIKQYNVYREERRKAATEYRDQQEALKVEDPLKGLKEAMSGGISYSNIVSDANSINKAFDFKPSEKSIDDMHSKLENQVAVMQRITENRNEAARAAEDELKNENSINKSLDTKLSKLKEIVSKQVASGDDINPLTGASNNRNTSDISVDTNLVNFSAQLKEQLESQVTVWDKLKQKVIDMKGGYKTATDAINDNSNALDKNRKAADSTAKSTGGLLDKVKHFAVSYRIMSGFIRSIVSGFYNLYKSAADYEEALNLYRVSLGEYAEQADVWAKRISNALYLDPKDIMQYTGAFYNLVNGLGVGGDAAYTMATNLTQLSYDMSSYLNIDAESAYEKLTSAITGQSRAVVTAGVAMQQASLQELAYSLGIKKKVSTMTQAEKTFLRYIQIMKSTEKMQGDLARTIVTPENAMRLMQTQFSMLGRAIGQVFIPIVLKAIPYVMALTEVLTELANKLAKWSGYEIQPINYDKFKNANKALKNTGNEADKAGSKINRTLAAFDDLNVVESKSSGSGSGGVGSVAKELEEYVKGYDMLKGLTSSMKDNIAGAKENLKKFGDIIITIAGVLGAFKLIKGIGDVIQWVSGTGSALKTVMSFFGIGKTVGKGAAGVTAALEGSETIATTANKTNKSFKLPSFKTVIKGLGELALIVGAVVIFVGALGALSNIPGAKTALTDGTWVLKETFFTVAQIAIPLAATAYGVTLLSKLKVSDFSKGFANLAIVAGGMVVLTDALGVLSLIPGNLVTKGTDALKTVFDAIGDIAVTLTATTIGIHVLSKLKVSDFSKGFANFSIVVGGVTGLVTAVGLILSIPGFSSFLSTGVDSMKQVFNGIADIALPLVGVATAMEVLSKTSPKNMAKGLADLAIVIDGTIAVIEVIGMVISIPYFKDFLATGIKAMQDTFNGIASIALPLGGVTAALGAAGMQGGQGVKSIVIGLADLAIVIGGTEILITAIGGLLSIGSLKEFLATGIDAIKKTFNGLAEIMVPLGVMSAGMLALGSLGGGGALAIATGLGDLAIIIGGVELVLVALGALYKIPGFSDLVNGGIKALVDVCYGIGEMAGALIAGFIDIVAGVLPNIGKDLAGFAINAKPFFEISSGITADTMKGVKYLAEALLSFTKTGVLDSLTSWFTGGASLESFGKDLKKFGPDFKKYADSIKGVDEKAVKASTSAALSLAEFSGKLPKHDGLKQWFTGDNKLSDFAKCLPDFGKNMKTYYNNVKDIDNKIVEGSAATAQTLSEFSSKLPKHSGVKQWFTGDNKISDFAKCLPEFGKKMKEYANNIADLDPSVVEKSGTAAKSLATMAKNLPNWGGAVSLFTGDNKLSDFGKDLAIFGTSFSQYYGKIKGIDANKVDAVSNAVKDLVNSLKTYDDKSLSGAFRDFRTRLSEYGDATKKMFEGVFSTQNGNDLGTKFGNSIGSKMKNAIKSKLGSTISLTTGKSDTAATYTVKMYKDGGFPTKGDLFFANEAGPEYITSIGNRSAVANQDQMVAALSGAIITAMTKIPVNNQPGVTQVYIGNEKVYEGQGTYQNRQADRYGTNVIKI